MTLITDLVRYLAGQVEDGVLVWLDGLGGVDDEDERGVEGAVAGLTQPALGGLWASLAPGGENDHLQYQYDYHNDRNDDDNLQ